MMLLVIFVWSQIMVCFIVKLCEGFVGVIFIILCAWEHAYNTVSLVFKTVIIIRLHLNERHIFVFYGSDV